MDGRTAALALGRPIAHPYPPCPASALRATGDNAADSGANHVHLPQRLGDDRQHADGRGAPARHRPLPLVSETPEPESWRFHQRSPPPLAHPRPPPPTHPPPR